MEILKRGIDPGEIHLYTATCSNCNTQVRFKANEAHTRRNLGKPMLCIECPVCSHAIYVNSVTQCQLNG